jgi:hypothetical protein
MHVSSRHALNPAHPNLVDFYKCVILSAEDEKLRISSVCGIFHPILTDGFTV